MMWPSRTHSTDLPSLLGLSPSLRFPLLVNFWKTETVAWLSKGGVHDPSTHRARNLLEMDLHVGLSNDLRAITGTVQPRGGLGMYMKVAELCVMPHPEEDV